MGAHGVKGFDRANRNVERDETENVIALLRDDGSRGRFIYVQRLDRKTFSAV
jgi:hypothetical protein